MIFFVIFFIYSVGQTESIKTFKQEAMYAAMFDQLRVATFCPKQEIVFIIKKSKANELWIKGCIT